jgi:hypothetical protein
MRRCFSSQSGGARPEPQYAAKLTSLGTRRIFNSDHDMLREMARKFFETRVVPFHAQWEKEGQISRECWKEVLCLDGFDCCSLFQNCPILDVWMCSNVVYPFLCLIFCFFSLVRPVLRGCSVSQCPSRTAAVDKTFSARPSCGKNSPTRDAQAKQQTFDSPCVCLVDLC